MPTDPPYLRKRKYRERVALLEERIDDDAGWAISGSMLDWGDSLADRADLILFIEAPTDIRIARLRARERAKLGPRILPGGDMEQAHRHFMAWAAGYEDGSFGGRSREKHEDWLAPRTAKVLRIDGTECAERLVAKVCSDTRIAERNPASSVV